MMEKIWTKRTKIKSHLEFNITCDYFNCYINMNPLPFACLNSYVFTNLINEIQTNSSLSTVMNLEKIDKLYFDQFEFTDIDDSDHFPLNPDFEYFESISDSMKTIKYYFNEDYNELKNVVNDDINFSLCSFNIGSIPKNLNEFMMNCIDDKLKFDVIGLTETRLTDEISHLFKIEGYNLFTNNFQRNSGGIAMFIKDCFTNVTIRNDLNRSVHYLESLFVEIKYKNISFIVGTLYRRPNSNFNSFLDEYEGILTQISNENKLVYLMGDFNLNLLDSKTLSVSRYLNTLNGFNFISTINKPTRISSCSATIIDHIFTNNYMNFVKNGILYESVSDHMPVFSCFKLNYPVDNNNVKTEITYRSFSEDNLNSFKIDLQDVTWDLVLNSSNPEVAYDNFELIFLSIFNKNFPILTKTISKKANNKPYVTHEIREILDREINFRKNIQRNL